MGCNSTEFVSAVIVAGGKGERLGRDVRKQYIKLDTRTILGHTLKVFAELDEVGEIIVVVPPDDVEFVRTELILAEFGEFAQAKSVSVVAGGATRQESAMSGVAVVDFCSTLVLIHDAARPFVQKRDIRKVLQKARECGGAVLAVPVSDTLKCCNNAGAIIETVPRAGLYAAQTPQVFDADKIRFAHNWAASQNITVTDDAMLFEQFGYEVAFVEGSRLNIKITTEEDLLLAQALLEVLHEKH